MVKHRKYDVPALYDPHGIYEYKPGSNWRALMTMLVLIIPLLPGLAEKVTPQHVSIGHGLIKLISFN